MIVDLWNKLGSIEFWVDIFSAFQELGAFPPILLTFVEALIPMLPLVAIVTFNVAGHGMFWGFVYSWIGSTIGAIAVFMFFRNIKNTKLLYKFLHLKRINQLIQWVSRQDKKLLFLVSIFAFTPSCIVNISFGLSDFDSKTFIQTIVLAKLVMISSLVLFGTTVVNSLEDPVMIIVSVVILAILYFLSNYMSKKTGLSDVSK